MNAALPAETEKIILLLEGSGFCAYLAGSTVRSLVMKTTPPCFRILTSAKPHQIKTLFPRAKTHLHTSVLTVSADGREAELYTLADADGAPLDVQSFLSASDFTVNALAMNSSGGILDFFGGMNDISKRIIRCVRPPFASFSADPVRMLRAVRLSAELDFEIEDETMRGIRKYSVLIKKAPSARVREELNKILMSDRPEQIVLLREAGLLKHVMPELDVCFSVRQKNKYHIYNVGAHIIAALSAAPRDLVLRWAALFHDIGKPCCQSTDSSGIIHFYGHHRESVRIANDIMHRLHFDSALIHDVCVLVENHDIRIEPSPSAVKHMLARTGSELFEKLLALQEADSRGKNPKYLDEKLKKAELIKSVYRRITEENQPYRTSDLVVNSRDLIKLGFRAGREIGDTLRILLDEVLADPSLNDRAYLLKRVKQIKSKRRNHN